MKTTNNVFSKEKISKYLENKRDKLFEEGYLNQKHYNPIHDVFENVFYNDKQEYTRDELRASVIKELITAIPRERIMGEHEPIPTYLASGTRDDEVYHIMEKINCRSMTKEEYEKIMDQVEKYGSVVPNTNRRERSFGGGSGDVILSLTTNKIYDVDGRGASELLKDYTGDQYYSSRSGASGAGFIYASKKSLIYLPTVRMDTKHPGSEGSMQEINGLKMAVLTYRGQIDSELPTVIKDCSGVDLVLLNQEDNLSPDGSGKLLKEAILSKGKCFENRDVRKFTTDYYDENLQKKTLIISYKTNIPEDKRINFNKIGKVFLNISRGFDLESTGRFIDARIGLMKYKNKYVRIGTFGLIKQIFDENPIPEATERLFIDEREVGDKNQIIKSQIELPTMRMSLDINGREVYNNLAVKEKKYANQYDKYAMTQLCDEHHLDINELWSNQEERDRYEEEYYLVYEEKLSDLSSRFAQMENIYMEYEANIPYSIYHSFPRSYRERYMKRKLFDKAINERKNFSQWNEGKQKQIIFDYINKYADVEIQLEDSYAVGNCQPGTEAFISEYNLPKDKISIKKLSANKKFSAMLENSRFRAVLLHKILTLNTEEKE